MYEYEVLFNRPMDPNTWDRKRFVARDLADLQRQIDMTIAAPWQAQKINVRASLKG